MASNDADSSYAEKPEQNTLPGCIFCKIASGSDPSTAIVFQNERICIFKDIRPAAEFHFLAIPNHHIENVKSLTAADKPLLQELKQELVAVLRGKQIEPSNASFGFHIPPFTSVKHLHMHAIAPTTSMGLISRMIFRPNSMWFKTDDAILQSLPSNAAENL
ncbi:adenosine 5'-monophosphoramidase HINT3-like [Anopheles ziemanni]|uniref:adenosine 5'-monophosphoramidase HINT3-like n=1 Tax=Anopheles coustani TaxID=139045 RepID=UPI0026589B65|nr:adenosine 5'-monophosphoramidase HINT3-like [Anopheles coustani]XP_058166799.1 adenosine 5'-monophosphoramidase HINT3-like [Anopheles ziemanni]